MSSPTSNASEVEGTVESAVESTNAETEEPTPPARSGGRVSDLEAEGDIAADYLEELLDIADLDGDLDMDVEGAG